MMNWTEFIVVTLLNLAGYLSALMLGISLGEKHIIRQVNRTLEQMRKERACLLNTTTKTGASG